jgi:hypothetical protein
VTSVIVPLAHDSEDTRQSFRSRVQELGDLAANNGERIQQMAIQHASGGGPRTRDVASVMAAKATSAVNYLASKVPPIAADPEARRLGIDYPDDQALYRFEQQWAGVFDPLSILDDLESGRIDPDKVDAIKATAPRLWDDIRGKIMSQLLELDTPPEHATRVQLDLLLDANGAIEPTLSPGFLRVQASLKQHIAQEAQQRPPPRPSSNLQIANQQLTRTDQAIGAL